MTPPPKRKRGRPPKPPPDPISTTAPLRSVDDLVDDMRRVVSKEIADLMAPSKRQTGTQRQTQMQRCLKTLRDIGELTGESSEISEKKIVRLPAFRRVADVLLAAIKPHPAALAAATEALEAFAKGEAA